MSVSTRCAWRSATLFNSAVVSVLAGATAGALEARYGARLTPNPLVELDLTRELLAHNVLLILFSLPVAGYLGTSVDCR
jgi:hypothetical protein